MGIYKQGLNRKQQLMFPPSLDELVEEDNVVRAIEAYVAIKENNLTQIREEIAAYILAFRLNLGYFLERFLFL
ncbi:hypothetical protein [Sulfurimonas sp.]|uniref:hypothetical protein n=1 Tax=Sulfurimonas sp. TaxID=2022749 RepID=UPI002629DACF|nr:hypothetical protein [Sulfurimonas sp.]